MNDARLERVSAALVARFPNARVQIESPLDPDAMPLPICLIVMDAEYADLRAAEDFAIERTVTELAGEPMPYAWNAMTPNEAERYVREWRAYGAAVREHVEPR